MDVRLFPPPDFEDIATTVVEGPNTEWSTLRTMSGTAKKPDVPTLPPEAVPLMLSNRRSCSRSLVPSPLVGEGELGAVAPSGVRGNGLSIVRPLGAPLRLTR